MPRRAPTSAPIWGKALPLPVLALQRFGKAFLPVVALTTAGAVALLAQQPARDRPTRSQTDQPFAGAIRGRVVDVATNRALAKTRVTLFSDVGATPPLFTDANGNFAFQSLPAGHYTLLAEKTGYARLRYGARSDLDPPTEISIEAGSPVEDVLIHLIKGAAIFGRVYDEFGDPIVGGEISLSVAQAVGDAIRTVPVSRSPALTDDRGQYRIGDLPPGRYFVALAPASLGSVAAGAPREWERLAPWGKTFYPGAPSISEAIAIVLGTGEERGAVDFPVRSHERAQIRLSARGLAPAPSGPTFGSALNMWFFSADSDSPINGRQIGLNGTGGDMPALSLPNFPINEPGDWTVLARSGPDRAAIENFHLSAGDDLTVDLNLQPTSTVSGRVVFDGTATHPDALSISISVKGAGVDENIPGRFLLAPSVPAKSDGTFTLSNLVGTVDIEATTPPGWILSAAMHAGRNLLDDPLTLNAGENVSDVQLVFSDRVGAVAGRVLLPDNTPAAGCAIALFPDDALLRFTPRRMRLARADQRGQFSIRGLPAGAYRAAAAVDIDAASWLTPGAIDRLRQISSPVILAGRGEVTAMLQCAVSQ